MPALLIADIEVRDLTAFSRYTAAAADVIKKFGGRYIALRGEVKALEGDWNPRRIAIIEFKDMDTLNAFYGIVTLIAGLRPLCLSVSQVDEHNQLFRLPVPA